jgi:hypothetical protein
VVERQAPARHRFRAAGWTAPRRLGSAARMRMRQLLAAVCCLAWVACAAPPRPAEATPAAAVVQPPVPAPAELLRAALDDEALYTLAGGLKPVSLNFQSLTRVSPCIC